MIFAFPLVWPWGWLNGNICHLDIHLVCLMFKHLSFITSPHILLTKLIMFFPPPGVSQAQCSPVPLPALGTQRIIQGNGTTVGTIISLQCPAKHRLVGSEMMCVMDNNSTYWTGETYCKRKQKQKAITERKALVEAVGCCICESNCL